MELTEQDRRTINSSVGYDWKIEELAEQPDWRAKLKVWCQETHRDLAIRSWRADKMKRDAERILKDCDKILKSEPSDETQTEVAITRWKANELLSRAFSMRSDVHIRKTELGKVELLIGFSYTDI